MHTTTPSSRHLCERRIPGRFQWLLLSLLGSLLSGCAQIPSAESFFELTPESARHRALQTRWFETSDEKELLSASAAVLQDLGFQLEESSTAVGVLRAAKERGAREYAQEIAQGFVLVLSVAVTALAGEPVAVMVPVDVHQQVNATLVTRRSETDPSRFSVRIMFHRTIWKGDGISGDQHIPPGQQSLEMIHDGEIYQQFFAKLSKSVFLEAHEI